MRIFVSCLQSLLRHRVPAHDFWGPYFKRGIEEAGHEWFEAEHVDWAEGLTLQNEGDLRSWRDRVWSEVLRVLRSDAGRRNVDLLLGYFFPQMVEQSAIREIRRMGIPCVNFFCDNVREFRSIPESFREFDLHWVPEFEALHLYEAAGCKHILAPMPCWIPPALRRADHPEVTGPTFVGSFDPLRAELLGNAIRRGADLTIAGVGWRSGEGADGMMLGERRSLAQTLRNQVSFMRRHGLAGWCRKIEGRLRPIVLPAIPESRLGMPVTGAEYTRLMQESIVALGVNRVPTFRRSLRRPLTYSRLRDIEAPMLGACYLTEWTEGLAKFYQIGRHIETYRTAQELAEKLRELLADRGRRSALRAAAQQHALRELSVPRSMEKIRQALGLGGRMPGGAP